MVLEAWEYCIPRQRDDFVGTTDASTREFRLPGMSVNVALRSVTDIGLTKLPGIPEAEVFWFVDCRVGCAACCIAPSISSPIPGMPLGKPAGVRCVQLDGKNRCMLFGKSDRPDVCLSLEPSLEMCGFSNDEAMAILVRLEAATHP